MYQPYPFNNHLNKIKHYDHDYIYIWTYKVFVRTGQNKQTFLFHFSATTVSLKFDQDRQNSYISVKLYGSLHMQR